MTVFSKVLTVGAMLAMPGYAFVIKDMSNKKESDAVSADATFQATMQQLTSIVKDEMKKYDMELTESHEKAIMDMGSKVKEGIQQGAQQLAELESNVEQGMQQFAELESNVEQGVQQISESLEHGELRKQVESVKEGVAENVEQGIQQFAELQSNVESGVQQLSESLQHGELRKQVEQVQQGVKELSDSLDHGELKQKIEEGVQEGAKQVAELQNNVVQGVQQLTESFEGQLQEGVKQLSDSLDHGELGQQLKEGLEGAQQFADSIQQGEQVGRQVLEKLYEESEKFSLENLAKNEEIQKAGQELAKMFKDTYDRLMDKSEEKQEQ